MSITIDPKDPDLGHGVDESPVPQNKKYLVLSDEEIAKGYIRPLRRTYVHRGKKMPSRNEGVIREYTDKEKEEHKRWNSAAEMVYSDEYKKKVNMNPSTVGVCLTEEEYNAFKEGKEYIGGCGVATIMADEIAKTYARNPYFYGSTYCISCKKHLPVSEFLWDDGEVVGS